jgi:hypothetical protein
MSEQEPGWNEQESLRLITEMIQKAKSHFHESGTSAILWGAVIAICGLVSFAEWQWNFSIGFDIWWLTLAAVVPQVWIIVRESRLKIVKTHQQAATDIVWMIYAISILALVIYQSVVPGVTDRGLAQEGIQLLSKNPATGEITNFHYFIPSFTSIYLVLYAFPTIATGLIAKFKPMIAGAILCYGFFVLSLFTSFGYDMLLSALAGIFNWLLPGLLLRSRYFKGRR